MLIELLQFLLQNQNILIILGGAIFAMIVLLERESINFYRREAEINLILRKGEFLKTLCALHATLSAIQEQTPEKTMQNIYNVGHGLRHPCTVSFGKVCSLKDFSYQNLNGKKAKPILVRTFERKPVEEKTSPSIYGRL